MDQHRDVQLGAHLPDRIEIGVVDRQARSVRLGRVESPSFLKTFKPIAPSVMACRSARPPSARHSGVPAPFQLTLANTRNRSLYGLSRIELHRLPQAIAAPAREVDHHAQVQRIHLLDELRDVVRVHAGVVVDVDDRELRFRHQVLGRRRRWTSDGSRRWTAAAFLGRLAPARPHLGHAGRALLAVLNRHRVGHSPPAPASAALLLPGLGEQSAAGGERRNRRYDRQHPKAPHQCLHLRRDAMSVSLHLGTITVSFFVVPGEKARYRAADSTI